MNHIWRLCVLACSRVLNCRWGKSAGRGSESSVCTRQLNLLSFVGLLWLVHCSLPNAAFALVLYRRCHSAVKYCFASGRLWIASSTCSWGYCGQNTFVRSPYQTIRSRRRFEFLAAFLRQPASLTQLCLSVNPLWTASCQMPSWRLSENLKPRLLLPVWWWIVPLLLYFPFGSKRPGSVLCTAALYGFTLTQWMMSATILRQMTVAKNENGVFVFVMEMNRSLTRCQNFYES